MSATAATTTATTTAATATATVPQWRISPSPDGTADSGVRGSPSVEEDGECSVLRLAPSMDSSFCVSEAGSSWACPQCSYFNVDGKTRKCALCGSRDPTHILNDEESKRTNRNKRNHKHRHKSSWFSVGNSALSLPPTEPVPVHAPVHAHAPESSTSTSTSASASLDVDVDIDLDSDSDSDSGEQSIPPLQEQRRPTLLVSNTTSTGISAPLSRPTAEDQDEDDDRPLPTAGPSMPPHKEDSTSHHPARTTTSRSTAMMGVTRSLTGSSLGGMVRERGRRRSPEESTGVALALPLRKASVASPSAISLRRQVSSTEDDEGDSIYSPDTCSVATNTSNSHRTVRTSNRSLESAPPLLSHLSAPVLSNKRSNRSSISGSDNSGQLQSTTTTTTMSDIRNPQHEIDSLGRHPAIRHYRSEPGFSLPMDVISKDHEQRSSSRAESDDRGNMTPLILPTRTRSMLPSQLDGREEGRSNTNQRTQLHAHAHVHVADSKKGQQQQQQQQLKSLDTQTHHTIQSNTTSYASEQSAFADDYDVETIGQRLRADRHQETASGTSIKHGRKWRMYLVVGATLVLVAVIVLSVLLTGKDESKSLDSLSNSPPDDSDGDIPGAATPTAAPTRIELSLAASMHGTPLEQLGSSVSIGGPLGNWIAIVGQSSIQVARLNVNEMTLEPIGNNITIPTGVSQISLSAERRRLAVGHSGQVSIFERRTTDGDWEEIVNATSIGNWEDILILDGKTSIATSCAISGSGLVVAGGAILRTTKGSSATVEILQFDNDRTAFSPRPISFPIDPSANTIEIDLSYDGTLMVVLVDNRVKVYQRQTNQDWREVSEQSAYAVSSTNVAAMALSGNGQTLVTAIKSETTVFEYDAIRDAWTISFTINAGATSLALSYDGKSMLIGNKMDQSNFGTAMLMQRDSFADSFVLVREVTGLSRSAKFGVSVSIPKNRQWDLVAFGAPSDGDQMNGAVHVYQKAMALDGR